MAFEIGMAFKFFALMTSRDLSRLPRPPVHSPMAAPLGNRCSNYEIYDTQGVPDGDGLSYELLSDVASNEVEQDIMLYYSPVHGQFFVRQ